MENKPVLNLRGSDCSPEWEEEFNKWYNEVHVPMLLESGEIEKVTRYRRIGEDEKYPKYLVIYQFENQQAFERYEASSELAAAVEDARNRWPAGSYEPSWRVQYEFVSDWKR